MSIRLRHWCGQYAVKADSRHKSAFFQLLYFCQKVKKVYWLYSARAALLEALHTTTARRSVGGVGGTASKSRAGAGSGRRINLGNQ